MILSELQSYEQSFSFPSMGKEADMKLMIEEKIGATFPIVFEELVYDFQLFSGDKTTLAFVIAAQKEVIASYERVLKKECGLKVSSIEPELWGLMRNINFPKDLQQACIVINVKSNEIQWFLLYKGFIFDSNTVNIEAYRGFTKDLKQSISFFKKNFPYEIEAIFTLGLEVPERIVKALGSFDLPIQEVDTLVPAKVFLKRAGITTNMLPPDRYPVIVGGALKEILKGQKALNLSRSSK